MHIATNKNVCKEGRTKIDINPVGFHLERGVHPGHVMRISLVSMLVELDHLMEGVVYT